MDGEWEPPMIDNPDYKGEWKPKQIKNPEYKVSTDRWQAGTYRRSQSFNVPLSSVTLQGKWIHPDIDNPEYTPDDKLYLHENWGAIGFDLWQVQTVVDHMEQ